MTGERIGALEGEGGLWLVVAAAFGLALAALCGLWLRLRKIGRGDGSMPSGGEIRLLLDGRRVIRASPGAATLLGFLAPEGKGDAAGLAIADASPEDHDVSAILTRFFGAGAAPALDALGGVLRCGQGTRRLIRREDGAPFEFWVRPHGGYLAIDLHDAGFVLSQAGQEATPALSQGIAPPLDAGAAGEVDPATPAQGGAAVTVQGQALEALLTHGALVMWVRAPDGHAHWASGSIRVQGREIGAAETLDLLTTRQHAAVAGRLVQGPQPRSQALRLEVVSGSETLPLSIVEVAGPAGTRAGYAVDASAAATAERTLTRFVQSMTETFAHLTVGLAIFDRNRSLALFNPAIVDMWRLDPAWLARRPSLRDILDRMRAARRIPEMRDYHGWRDRLIGLFDDAERVDFEELWNLADGSTIRVLARPHPHGSLALIFDDATERMRLEQHNRHMDDLINTTLYHLHEGLAVIGPDGTLQYINRALHDIWSTDEESLTAGTHVRDFCTLCSRQSVETEVWDRVATYATGEQGRSAWTARIALGSGRMLRARFAPLPDGSTMAVFGDVTDSERIAAALRERNEALEAAERMRAAVLDQISHRLRTPLNTIFGFGELLSNPRNGSLDERQQGYAAGILEAAAQLLDTTSAVTEMASLQIDPLEGEAEGQAVEEVLSQTIQLLAKRAAEAQVRLGLVSEGQIGVLDCAPARLRQIAFNLMADAIHRCPAGGRVSVLARREEDGMVEIATEETPRPDRPSGPEGLDQIGIESMTLSQVRRLVAAEGGALEIGTTAQGDLRIQCRFPEPITAYALPAAASN